MALLSAAFKEALTARSGEDGADAVLAYVEANWEDVSKVLDLFSADGQRQGGRPAPASAFNDFYKFTMLPVMRSVELARGGDVRCTFSVNIRDEGYRERLLASAIGKAAPDLFQELEKRLGQLAARRFDRETFEQCVTEYSLPGWDKETLDAICGTKEDPRMLVQELLIDPKESTPVAPSQPGHVLVQVFVARDEKLKADRVYIEATGPWHRVTWLETTMMQAVYDALFRDRRRQESGTKRSESGEWDDSAWYPAWLAEAMCRCGRSVAAAQSSGLQGGLMTGRRTGGLAFMILQGLYVQHALGPSGIFLGTSSVTSRYMCLEAGVDPAKVPRCMGTHAHELSMVIGAVVGELDDKAGAPLSQLVGHMLYFFRSRPGGDVREAQRKALMPMLTDTLGTRAFMKVASALKVPKGPHAGEPVLSIMGAARQDSGTLPAFKRMMEDFGYSGSLMASEIETANDLMKARECGFTLFGAGGFMGDSEKAWNAARTNISMAVKVLRVHVSGERSRFTPVKTGETEAEGQIKEGKFEADGTLSAEELQKVRDRAQVMASADSMIDSAQLQKLFEDALNELLGPGP